MLVTCFLKIDMICYSYRVRLIRRGNPSFILPLIPWNSLFFWVLKFPPVLKFRKKLEMFGFSREIRIIFSLDFNSMLVVVSFVLPPFPAASRAEHR